MDAGRKEASPKTRRLRCSWNPPQQTTNTEDDILAFTGHGHLQELTVILRKELSLRWESAAVMKRMSPAETSLCVFLGHQQDPPTGLPKGEAEGQDVGWCPGNCQEVGGTCKSYASIALLEKVVISLLKEMRFFFSITTNPTTITSQGAIQQTQSQPSPHLFFL